MKVLKGIVIIIYIILGAALGILLIPEILKDFNINGYPFLHNYYIDGLIGIVVFFLILASLLIKLLKLLKPLNIGLCSAVLLKFYLQHLDLSLDYLYQLWLHLF